MITRDQIEMRKSQCKEAYTFYFRLNEFEDICDLALVGLSVQEGLKDAREIVDKVRTVSTIDEESNGELAAFFEIEDTKAAQLIAAFALKEVVEEFDAHVNKCHCTSWCNRGQIEGRDELTPFIGQRVHVTISLPQQEQE